MNVEKSHTYFAINASAGSGKTYSLVQKLLMLCLQTPGKSDGIRNILALTFTNKAANEMKERILGWLVKFTAENYKNCSELLGIQEKFKEKGLSISLEELHERAKKVLDFILHHYSTLNIGTIDKFNARLVRSFSNELGLAQNFNLEIQSAPFLIEAVDKLLDKIGPEDHISEVFMDFINYKLDNEERIYINETLYKKAKHFLNDIHYEELKKNKDFSWDLYESVKERLRNEIKTLKHENVGISKNALALLKEKRLQIEEFAGGTKNGLGIFFTKYQGFSNGKLKDFPFPGNEEKALLNFEKGASAKGKARQSDILEILPLLLEARNKIIDNYILWVKKETYLQELLPLKINKEIQDQLALIEEENDLVLLSKFNVMIKESLKEEPSSFIYEKVGAKYEHYFLDEFQDTARMQWENMLPLRDNIINGENQTFTLVGDPKQSIYRFRGGDAAIMLDILNQKEQTNVPVRIENLEHNWRSAKNIVNFNNELYQFLSQDLALEHQLLFGEKGRQTAQVKFDGRVKINLQDYSSTVKEYYETAAQQMKKDIQECLDNGFTFSDIAILCRDAKAIQQFSQLLGKIKINYEGETQYIKTISEKGLVLSLSITLKAIIELLRWQIQPENKQHLVKLFYYLNESGRISIENFTAEMESLLAVKSTDEVETYVLERFHLRLNSAHFTKLNLYNNIEFFVHEFAVESFETDFLLNFLEMVYNYSQNSSNTLTDFLKFWNEEGSEISIQASENLDAIRLMTIHAAKGLEFPVVFLPLKNSSTNHKETEWFQLNNYEELKSINIPNFSAVFESYDDEIRTFNTENMYKDKIDRFCVQYVSTTRPIEQLFFYLQKKSNSGKNHVEVLDFIDAKNPNNLLEFDLYPETNGSFKKQTGTKTEKFNTKSIKFLKEKGVVKNNLKIATPSKNYQVRNEKVRLGIFTHEILSKIKTEKDVDFVLQQYLLDGTINLREKELISNRLFETIKNPACTEYFSDKYSIISERDILVNNSGNTEIYRPDRLIETPEGWIIIDFKTGEESEDKKHQYEKQLLTYKTVIENLGKKVIKTEIVYV